MDHIAAARGASTRFQFDPTELRTAVIAVMIRDDKFLIDTGGPDWYLIIAHAFKIDPQRFEPSESKDTVTDAL